jgi:hypothetical protein
MEKTADAPMREPRHISRSKDLEPGAGEPAAETMPQQPSRNSGSGRDHSGATEKPRKL